MARNPYRPLHHFSTRGNKQPLSLQAAQNQLDIIERSRTWVPMAPSQTRLVALDYETVGIDGFRPISTHAFNTLKAYTGVNNERMPSDSRPHDARAFEQLTRTCEKVNAALPQFKRELRLRTDMTRGFVLGVVTDRYQHLPYNRLLDKFPSDWLVPRLTVDNAFCEVSVCHPDALDQRDGLLMGLRNITSDVGLCRATSLAQALKLVCANGMISVKEIEIIKRFHLAGYADVIQMEWDARIGAFVADFDKHVTVNRDQLRIAAKRETTAELAIAELEKLGLGKLRAKAALEYAEREYGLPLNRYSVGQGVTYVSQATSREEGRQAALRDTIHYDMLATQYMAA